MKPSAAGLRITEHDGVSRVDFVDRNILDEANIQQIGEELSKLVESSPRPKILICFENVEHLSSAALGVLITISNGVKGRDGQLRLSDIRPQLLEVFKITRLDQMFEIHDSANDAQALFG
ncbi:MAG: STAS domain-containing protein [Phycisphaera sp.]|nr:STAS domain-containing protein [Phycisphaera sp.]MDG1899522.1 STAS domain-containing protein [Phycisphaerales bacterium]